MPRVLFVGDVHLRASDPAGSARFLRFLDRERRRGAGALYLLGDLFDYWIGPKHIDGADYRETIGALKEFSRSVRVEFLCGNRDYLVEDRFARATGIEVAGESVRVKLGGREILATHGDTIYNRNPKYSAYRAIMKFGPLRSAVTSIPARVGKGLARGFRKVSRRTTRDVEWTREELVEGARPVFERGVDVLICGHIHRPAHVRCRLGGRAREIFVVGDWLDGTCDYVEWDGQELSLKRPEP